MASSVSKYEIGQVFKSTRHENEAFIISDKVAITKAKTNAKGSVTTPATLSYLIEYIPDIVEHRMPSGVMWVKIRQPFTSNDDIINREIAVGNWEAVE